MAPTPAKSLTGKPGRDAKDHRDHRDLAALCWVPICSQQDQGLEMGADHTWRLLVTQSPQWKEAFVPHKTVKLLSPRQCCYGGKGCSVLCHHWVGWKPKAQPGINPYLIPVYNVKAKLHLKGRERASKANASKLSTELRQQRLSDTPGNIRKAPRRVCCPSQ